MRHLDQVDAKVGIGLLEHLVEALGVVGIDHGIDRRLPLVDRQRPNHFQVAKMRADQHSAAPGGDHFEQLGTIREINLTATQFPEPCGQFIQSRLGKAQHVPEAVAPTRRRHAAPAAHPLQVVQRSRARLASSEKKVADNRVQQPACRPLTKKTVASKHGFQAEHAAAFGQFRPMLARRTRAKQFACQQQGQPQQHAAGQSRVHFRNAQVVTQHVEMRNAILRVDHPRIDDFEFQPGPRQTHQNLDIKIHSRWELYAVNQSTTSGERIKAETAHRIGSG